MQNTIWSFAFHQGTALNSSELLWVHSYRCVELSELSEDLEFLRSPPHFIKHAFVWKHAVHKEQANCFTSHSLIVMPAHRYHSSTPSAHVGLHLLNRCEYIYILHLSSVRFLLLTLGERWLFKTGEMKKNKLSWWMEKKREAASGSCELLVKNDKVLSVDHDRDWLTVELWAGNSISWVSWPTPCLWSFSASTGA